MLVNNIFYYEIILIVCLNFLIISQFSKIKDIINIQDSPDNSRKFHKNETPLLGGIIILSNLIFIWILSFFFLSLEFLKNDNSFFLGALLFFCVGLIDDKFQLKPILKLLLTSFIVLIIFEIDSGLIVNKLYFEFLDNPIVLGNLSIPITLLCFLLLSNAFNMFDGINLQLSLYVLQIFIFLFFINVYPLLIIFMLFSLLTFIFLNFKGKTFLGESGSNSLTFLVAFLLIKTYNQEQDFFFDENIKGIHVEQIFIILSLPGLDMIRLFFSRLQESGSPFKPDRKHIHHILTDRMSFFKSLLIIQGFTFISMLFAILSNNHYLTILLVILAYTCLIFFFNKVKPLK